MNSERRVSIYKAFLYIYNSCKKLISIFSIKSTCSAHISFKQLNFRMFNRTTHLDLIIYPQPKPLFMICS